MNSILKLTSAIAVLISCSLHAADKPNILFLLSDDQRADGANALGNPDLITPNIDKLVHSGVTFNSLYCMGSNSGAVCAPSRAMILTGRTLFKIPQSYLVPWEAPDGKKGACPYITMPEHLRQNGYATFQTGKWHQDSPTFVRGFTHAGNIFMGGMGSHTEVKIWDFDPEGKKYGKNDSRIGTKFSSTLFADAAIEFLETTRPKEKPFFMYVSFTAPHDPRTPPADVRKLYDDSKLKLPENYMPDHPFNNGELFIRDENTAAHPRTPAVVRKELGDYYGMITQMDTQIGRILAALEKSGELDNTYIIFTSDHGLAMGSHGLMGKQNVYVHSMRAPMVIGGPSIKGQKENDELVYLLDVFPTVCSMAGIKIPESVEGKSMMPLLNEQPYEGRKAILTAYKSIQRAVTTKEWKLIRYPEINKTQLFNLKKDPHEKSDLVGNPEYAGQVKKMTALLKELQVQNADKLSLTVANPQSEEYDPETYFILKRKERREKRIRRKKMKNMEKMKNQDNKVKK